VRTLAPDLPSWQVPHRRAGLPGEASALVLPLLLADGSGQPTQGTALRLGWDEEALHVRFECVDREPWGTYRHRDDPLYLEECIEVFLAPGAADPAEYFELEVSPLGTLFDARVHNPDSRRDTLTADLSWDCPGLRWAAGPGSFEDWWAELAIPWAAVAPSAGRPRLWRANFFRIDRPPDGEPEFSCASPTLTRPADFHRPARFGLLALAD
jgi:hypothetical protein